MWLKAALWGFVSGVAIVIGAAVGFYAPIARRVTATIMAFGAGVLISALAFDLMDEAYKRGGFDSTSYGFLGGAIVYTGANYLLSRRGAKHRKRSGSQQPSEQEAPGSGLAIAVGALLDGIPESIAVGVSIIGGGAVSVATVAAIFLSNVPEGMSAAVGMRHAGRSATYVLGLHLAICIVSTIAAVAGFLVFSHLSKEVNAATIATAAGAILAMLADTMMPEAYEEAHSLVGLITVAGFLAAFVLTKLGA